jgi:Ca-activated chloride channel family protein
MTFLWPMLLVAVVLVPPGLVVVRWIERRRGNRVLALTGHPAAPPTNRVRRPVDQVGSILVVLALLVLAVALARPQASLALPRFEGTLMLTFDVSASMAAADVVPTRLDAAKAVARQIVDQRPTGVVIGVVAFSNGGMSVQMPTDDAAAVLAAIERLTPTSGTSLASGVLATLDAIDVAAAETPPDYYSNRSAEPTATPKAKSPGTDAGTLIVVLSDGENTAESDPVEAAEVTADRGIRMFTIGVGTTEGAKLELDGFSIHSALDETTLRQMADTTDGWYRSAETDGVADDLYAELEPQLIARAALEEVTAPVAVLGLLLLVAGASLSLARAGRLP